MIFPVVTYGCESWTVKKGECQKIDAFELWCWRRLLRVPWTARRSNQSILNEISLGVLWKDWCWSWNSSTLATSCEELTHWKRLWLWEGLGAGGEGDNRGWDGWMASPTRWTWVWVNSGSWWRTGRPGVLRFMGSQIVGHHWGTELNWVTLKQRYLQVRLQQILKSHHFLIIFLLSTFSRLYVLIISVWQPMPVFRQSLLILFISTSLCSSSQICLHWCQVGSWNQPWWRHQNTWQITSCLLRISY